jgi:hypothetical protein
MRSKMPRLLAGLTMLTLLVGLLTTLPASGKSVKKVSAATLNQVSGAVASRYFIANPKFAPEQQRARFTALHAIADQAAANGYQAPKGLNPPVGDRLNDDTVGLPQNEESVGLCNSNTSYVLEGTNDYRGLLDPEFNFTGWHFSNDGGASLANEGLLPHIVLSDGVTTRPSGGDPVDFCQTVDGAPTLYAGSLNYDPFDPFGLTSAIGGYMSDPATLGSCPGGTDTSCWPTSISVAESAPGHFLDKEWMAAGNTGDGVHVWFTWSDFDNNQPCCFADIMAARCLADLSSCSAPIQIDDPVIDQDIQFSDVTVGPDGRTYITYAQIIGEIEGTAETFVIKSRVGDAGCEDISCFGPIQTVDSVDLALPFGGFLQGNDFRIATVPKSIVKLVNGSPRIFVVFDECRFRLGDTLCEHPKVKLRYSDDDGATWSSITVLSRDAVNYFPSIANDNASTSFVVAYYTHRFDTVGLENAQDIEMVTVDAATLTILKRQRVTDSNATPNETEADPTLGGFFIGDYIELAAHDGLAYIGYNMNTRNVAIFGEGVRIPQQDNFLSVIGT